MTQIVTFRVKRLKRVARNRSKAITPKGNNPNQAGSVTNGDPDSKRDMGSPDTTGIRRPNSLNLRNDSSAMMAGNLTSTSRNPTKTLEDEVKELRLVNEELERKKAARALEDELQ